MTSGSWRVPVAAVLLLAVGCDDHLIGIGEYNSLSCVREPPLTYENYGRGFLSKYCTGCHSSLWRDEQRNDAPVGVDFDTWDGVLEWADRIEERGVPESGGMPPAGGASVADREIFAEWLHCEVLPAAAQVGP